MVGVGLGVGKGVGVVTVVVADPFHREAEVEVGFHCIHALLLQAVCLKLIYQADAPALARALAERIGRAAGGSSGIYLDRLFEGWGIAPQVRAKAVLVPGGLVAARVVDGSADVAIHQISEILAVPDAVLVGPIPAEIQNYTVYAGAVAARTAQAAAARELLEWWRLRGRDPREKLIVLSDAMDVDTIESTARLRRSRSWLMRSTLLG